MNTIGNLLRVVKGEKIGTLVNQEKLHFMNSSTQEVLYAYREPRPDL